MRYAMGSCLALGLAAALHAADARADLYKCVGKDSKISYQAEACSDGEGEKRLRTPVGGGASAGGNNGSGLKAGWDDEKSGPIIAGCIRNGLSEAKRAYAAAGGDWRNVREPELNQALEGHCACMLRRITTTMTYADFAANPTSPMQRVSADAANGGECKLDVSGMTR